jgi:hypothetical protein
MSKIYIELDGNIPNNWNSIITDIANHRPVDLSSFTVTFGNNLIEDHKEELSEYLQGHSLTELLESQLLLEWIAPQGAVNIPIIAKYIGKRMKRVGITSEIIIVDPYMFANNKRDSNYRTKYTNIINQVFSAMLTNVNNLVIICSKRNRDMSIKWMFESTISSIKPGINISVKYSQNWHDRFWISNNRTGGIIVGSSLNSLGNKYFLIDRLKNDDVNEIIAKLRAEGSI